MAIRICSFVWNTHHHSEAKEDFHLIISVFSEAQPFTSHIHLLGRQPLALEDHSITQKDGCSTRSERFTITPDSECI